MRKRRPRFLSWCLVILLLGITGATDIVWCFRADGSVGLESEPFHPLAADACCHSHGDFICCDHTECRAHLLVFDHFLQSDLTSVRAARSAGPGTLSLPPTPERLAGERHHCGPTSLAVALPEINSSVASLATVILLI
ncbi:MAG: hypothetical protein LDL33_07520 [Desulfomonile sp.]|nr:hypothetical protein [Desulfomonile sp.]